MKIMYGAAAVLSPASEPVDQTLTAFLAAPLPDEVLDRTENPANVFGKYVFLHEIGRGATGTVVKAWDTYLSRHVALKFLHASAPKNVELEANERVEDFLREARIAARLQHPNIVTVHEVDCREGRYYISMDFIEGGTLSDVIHGALEPKAGTHFYLESGRLLGLLRTIAIAVHYAHTQIPPVVHRDLKPQNVLIDAHGQPFVADFGLANEIQVEPGDGRSGGVRGTPAYMAPEQALGETADIDPRTDVYSLGVILYEMLTGDVPFRGSNIPSILRKLVTEPAQTPGRVVARLLKNSAEVAACSPDMRANLDAICLKALSKRRENRYQTALEFADALEPWTMPVKRGASTSASEIRGPVKKRRLRALVLSSVLLLVLAFTLPLRIRSLSPASAQASVPGDDIALLATGFLSSGKWTPLQGAVTELKRRAAAHPRLPEFENALAAHVARVGGRRKEWSSLLDRLFAGSQTLDPDDLRARLREFSEVEDEFRSDLRRTLLRLESSLLDEAREISANGPGDAWISAEVKNRAASVRERIITLMRLANDPDLGTDARPLSEAKALVDRVIAYLGAWSLRINVAPYAECRILQGGKECARDVTPAAFKQLEIGPAGTELELCWPSLKEPKRRWSASLPGLKPGESVIVAGDIETSAIEVERK